MSKAEKKSETVLVSMEPSLFEELDRIARSHDRPRGYAARELMVRGMGLHAIDGRLKDPGRSPVSEAFDLDAAIRAEQHPHTIISDWFTFEGRECPADYSVIFFEGWESFSHEERVQAVADAKNILDRQLRSHHRLAPVVASITPPVSAEDLRAEAQQMIDRADLAAATKPKRRRSK